jgi:hypothetical protein
MTSGVAEPVLSTPVTEAGLCRAFQIALLLTANIKHSELSVLEAIHSLDLEDVSDSALLHGSVAAALGQLPPQPDDVEHVSSLLPLKLRRILLLSTELRRVFVLRVLAGLSRWECARLLCRDAWHVDQTACAAAQELAAA